MPVREPVRARPQTRTLWPIDWLNMSRVKAAVVESLTICADGVDTNLVNTQVLERADRNNQNQTKHTSERSDQLRQPVRLVGRRELREHLEPQAREGPHWSSKI